MNGTEINGFKVQLHRRFVVERDRFYSKARENFCKAFQLGPFDFDCFVFLFPGEGTSSPTVSAAQNNKQQHEQHDDNMSHTAD